MYNKALAVYIYLIPFPWMNICVIIKSFFNYYNERCEIYEEVFCSINDDGNYDGSWSCKCSAQKH